MLVRCLVVEMISTSVVKRERSNLIDVQEQAKMTTKDGCTMIKTIRSIIKRTAGTHV